MADVDTLNPLARRAWIALVGEYPTWLEYLDTSGEDDLEVAIPAPMGSNAGHLVISTAKGEGLWIRFSPPFMCYPVEDETEMLRVIQQLLSEAALFLVTMHKDRWAGTTLIKPDSLPELEADQVAHIVSWSGRRDRTICAGKTT